jgi:hypothetical protein
MNHSIHHFLAAAALMLGCVNSGTAGDEPGDTGSGQRGDTATASEETDTPTADGETSSATGTCDTETGMDTTTSTETDTAIPTDTGLRDAGTDTSGDDDTDSATDTTGGEDTNEGTETSEGWETGDIMDADVCVEIELDVKRLPARVMLLEDQSGSMSHVLPDGSSKWSVAVGALSNLVTAYDGAIQFGLDLFTTIYADDFCAVGTEAVLDVAPKNGSEIVNILKNNARPDWATPLFLAMRNFTDPLYAPIFLDGSGESYLVIVSDGKDTCGEDGIFDESNAVTAEELSALAEEIVAEMNLQIYVIGFGAEIDPVQLNAIAAAGGTDRSTYYDAADAEELDRVLHEIGETVAVTCTFEIGEYDEDEVDLDYVNIKFDDKNIPRDDGCAANTGWTWVDDTRTAVRFCEKACDALTGTAVEDVTLSIACAPDDVVVILV